MSFGAAVLLDKAMETQRDEALQPMAAIAHDFKTLWAVMFSIVHLGGILRRWWNILLLRVLALGNQ